MVDAKSESDRDALNALETLLTTVRRPGDFFIQGALEAPMPRLEIAGTGVLSFPVPEAQVRTIIREAERAPYGRGEETIIDPAVRKVWQLTPEKFRLEGKSWPATLQQILSIVTNGLGCADANVTAELYKLLVYDAGGFFLAHRDTEKTGGMFATLVIVLPCSHRGGELVLRHAEREVVVDLSSTEVSELTFAAFYADCEHEVRPIAEGNRVCLIYNLIQQAATGKKPPPLTAPLHAAEAHAAAQLLAQAFAQPDAPEKIVWLLQHQYSPAGLSFAGLKGEDAARSQVLRQAAEQAGCAVHLGIVHIEESGPAEPHYDQYYGRRGRRGYYSDHEEETKEDASSDEFDIIEISDRTQTIDQWIDSEDRAADFGKLPLEDEELLPADALDDAKPDEQRLMEATGNEGASFERSYHRAALVLWPRERFADVLLQAGVGSVLPYLTQRIDAALQPSATAEERVAVVHVAGKVVDRWQHEPTYVSYRTLGKAPDRSAMLALLERLGDAALLGRFIEDVVITRYDGSENEALAASIALLGSSRAGEVLARLARENAQCLPAACANLIARVRARAPAPAEEWTAAVRPTGAAIVEALSTIKRPSAPNAFDAVAAATRGRNRPADAGFVAELLTELTAIHAPELCSAAVEAIVTHRDAFDPALVIVPALERLHARGTGVQPAADDLRRLWEDAAEFLLTRSEQPPAPPMDWRQPVTIACACADCRELQTFAGNAVEQVHRFRVRQDRRSHLHGQIDRHGLDMTHVTERKGSPQTLVCTKTRRTHERRCEQHRADLTTMAVLLRLAEGSPLIANDALAMRMRTARMRQASP